MEDLAKDNASELTVHPSCHHEQLEFCTTRASYRQGKELKAVKVYTINDESQYILIQNVPSIGLLEEVKRLVLKYGKTENVKCLQNYPTTDQFTHVFYVKYKLLKDARLAKRKLDNRSFFGNLLHVCYAPELETVEECRRKLQERLHRVQKRAPTYPRPKKTASNISISTAGASTATESTNGNSGTWQNLLPSTASKILK